MSRRQVADRLAAVPLFAGLTRKELGHLADGTEVVEVPAAALVVQQDDYGEGVFVILDGAARVVRNGRTVARLQAGSHFGELALLDPGPRTASVITTEPSRLGVLGAAAFRVGLRESPKMAERLLASLARRARDEGWRSH
ncbi:MAG TPA: cyclic nucleotide-binding domain-containing protein [Aquihabitans sp.]|jgi:CRP-like cAMP-binding protein|nr:cyclic nucleotide-binding domain-containing protein [Aquihabitans sp.]